MNNKNFSDDNAVHFSQTAFFKNEPKKKCGKNKINDAGINEIT